MQTHFKVEIEVVLMGAYAHEFISNIQFGMEKGALRRNYTGNMVEDMHRARGSERINGRKVLIAFHIELYTVHLKSSCVVGYI